MRRRFASVRLVSGFHLLEITLTLMVFALLAGSGAPLIKQVIDGYVLFQENTHEVQMVSRIVTRLRREVQLAVPGSLSLDATQRCLTFHPIEFSGFYKIEADDDTQLPVAMAITTPKWLEQINAGGYQFFAALHGREKPETQFSPVAVKSATEHFLSLADTLPSFLHREGEFYLTRDQITFCFLGKKLLKMTGSGENAVHTQLGEAFSEGNYFTLEPNDSGAFERVNVYYRSDNSSKNSYYHQQIMVRNAR
ncbi:MAG: PulJ/GspJ family protein [Enterovibrio sp.]